MNRAPCVLLVNSPPTAHVPRAHTIPADMERQISAAGNASVVAVTPGAKEYAQ